MELKVKAVPGPGEKSVQEVEETLLEQHEETTTDVVEEQSVEQEVTADEEVVSEAEEFGEEDVLSFIKSKYDKDIASVDDLFSKETQELPEDVSAFLNYKKETGRGINDFMKLQADFDQMKPDQLLRDYYAFCKHNELLFVARRPFDLCSREYPDNHVLNRLESPFFNLL